jgi:hypothetical protein
LKCGGYAVILYFVAARLCCLAHGILRSLRASVVPPSDASHAQGPFAAITTKPHSMKSVQQRWLLSSSQQSPYKHPTPTTKLLPHPSCNFNYIPHHPPVRLFSLHFFLFFLLFCDLSSRFFGFWAHSQHHPSAPAAGCVGWHHRKRTPGTGLLMQSDYFSQQPAGACNDTSHPPIYLETASPDKLPRKDIMWRPLLKFIANYSRGPAAGAGKKKPAENHPGR